MSKKRRELAIVIPAYKASFLEETLSSLASQRNQNFTVYIGDDASPFDLISIVEPYKSQLNIVYKRFEDNLGGTSLASHWERCIEMVDSEEWIWLFSDDDLADPNCVQAFYDTLEMTGSSYDLYRFNSSVIDKEGRTLQAAKPWPEVISSEEFLEKKLSFQLSSFACEYVFRRESILREGFVEFPLAWCSDDATWARIAKRKGICTISNASVAWRYSGDNLSSDYSKNYEQKQQAILLFFSWIKENFPHLIQDKFKQVLANFFIENIRYYQEPRTMVRVADLSRLLAHSIEQSFASVYAAMLKAWLRLKYSQGKSALKGIIRRSYRP